MTDATDDNPLLPKQNLLRWEISAALMIKIMLLIGLWFLIFRWMDRPASKPDIARRFALAVVSADFSAQAKQEANHVR